MMDDMTSPMTIRSARVVALALSVVMISGCSAAESRESEPSSQQTPAQTSAGQTSTAQPDDGAAELTVEVLPTGLDRGECEESQGRKAWAQGTLQCHVMDNGELVALSEGKEFDVDNYEGTPVERQMAFVADYWNTSGPSSFTYLLDTDCANFVSQSLLVRGWEMDDLWYNRGEWDMSSAWISSTAMREYLLSRDSVQELPDTQENRAEVEVGDIAQFDWDNSGDRDHTAVVSKVVTGDDGRIDIYVAEHTDPFLYRDVDFMTSKVHPGGDAFFLTIP
jgi:hypothetical protein